MLFRFALLLSCFFFVHSVSAQASPADKAMAESLFDHGLSLMRQGQYTEACNELERSQAVDRGIGTMLYLAECYEKLGRTASAWALFREASSAARAEGQLDRAKLGVQRADKLEPQLSKLTINVPSPVPGLQVLRNGQEVSSSVFGAAVPMDPGEQRFEARAAGYAPWSMSLNLPDNGATLSVDVPELTALAPSQLPPPLAASSEPPSPIGPPAASSGAPRDTAPHASVQGPVGLVLGGVGIVAIGLGSYFGARAISKNHDATKACPNEVCTTIPGKDLDDAAHSAATLSNVFVFGGAALLVGGAVLYFTRPRTQLDDRALSLSFGASPRGGQLVLGARL
jgi:hypothetical protein